MKANEPPKGIEDLDLCARALTCLKRAGIHTVDELRALSHEDLLHIPNLGRKSIEDIKEKLAKQYENLILEEQTAEQPKEGVTQEEEPSGGCAQHLVVLAEVGHAESGENGMEWVVDRVSLYCKECSWNASAVPEQQG